jgi:hypothetical protein
MNKNTYEQKWRKLKRELKMEFNATSSAVKEAIKNQEHQETRDMMLTKTTIQWVLDKMDKKTRRIK